MKKQNSLLAYLLIGIGIYFLLRELKIPILTDFYSWQTLLIIIGLALLIHSYTSKNYQNLFGGTIVLGLGIHLHGVQYYTFWIDHWAVFLLIIGLAFIVRYAKTKKGLLPGLLLIGLAILMIFSINLPGYFNWIYDIIEFLERFWPIAMIVIGIYLLKKK
ncbi:LiaI-LiaF-like domain-containing protein [Oceanobacillus saliphilus]|uniref:LiaI-LiaF-like domain-containing protein n=1 Tax=Oceanobacillus saliphilus TaxID=2925834 RepID=UPI00201D799B